MKKICITVLIGVLSFVNSYAQNRNKDQVTNVTPIKLEMPSLNLDSVLYKAHQSYLQNEIFNEFHFFFELATFTDESYLELFDGSHLRGFAFNPSIEMIKNALNRLKNQFGSWDIYAKTYEIYFNSNYCEVSNNFNSAYNVLIESIKSNCNKKSDCDEIKTQIKNSHQYINMLIDELEKFLKL